MHRQTYTKKQNKKKTGIYTRPDQSMNHSQKTLENNIRKTNKLDKKKKKKKSIEPPYS